MRINLFEKDFAMRDRDYNLPAAETWAARLKKEFHRPGAQDYYAAIKNAAIDSLAQNEKFRREFESPQGVPYGRVKATLLQCIPENTYERDKLAYNLVAESLSILYGEQDQYWESYKTADNKTWVRLARRG